MEYINIDIHIARDENSMSENAYLTAAVTKRSKKEREAIAQASFTLPPDLMQGLQPHLIALQARDPQKQESMNKVREFGKQLFDALFTGKVRILYDERKRYARGGNSQNSRALRLCLKIQPLELVVLPWELLFDARRNEFLCLSVRPKIVLVRSIKEPSHKRPLRYTPPLHLLGMVSDPRDLGPLTGPQEQEAIDSALDDLKQAKQVDLTWKAGKASSLEDLKLQTLNSNETWHAFHFIGHGHFGETDDDKAKRGQLVFENANQEAEYVSADRFCRSLPPDIKLVFLNACETARGNELDYSPSIAHSLAENGIPAVVGMQFKVADPAAKLFAANFYARLAKGASVDEAVTEARLSLSTARDRTNPLDWASPILYMSASSGALFNKVVKAPAESAQSLPSSEALAEPPQPLPSPIIPAPPLPPPPRRISWFRDVLLVVMILILVGSSGVALAIKLKPGPPTTRAATTPLPYIRPTPGPLSCVAGSITINGSTALQPLLTLVAQDYIQQCRATKGVVAKITVEGSDSGTGLEQAENRQVDIGSSDLFVRELFQPLLRSTSRLINL